ncbi:MAG: acyltransferase [Anaerolineales bacterium]|nr:acyltransferase [Anaerolineales bacterium]MBX3038659.1 acyltransferase [Anaerolineales bacterium]
MAEKSTNQSFYYPQLDGLRFFAFLLVFIHNAPHLESIKIWKILHEYGWIGVDIFFCLSAFLITKLLLLEYEKNKSVDLKKFYFRRCLRIVPLYVFYLLLASIYIILSVKQKEFLGVHLLSLITFTYNIAYFYLLPNNFVLFVHLWTISFEMQFYFVAPWFTKVIKSENQKKYMIFISLFLIGFIIRGLFIFYEVKHPIMYMSPFSHFEAVLLGAFLATTNIGTDNKINNTPTSIILFFAGIFVLSLVFLLPNTFEIGWHLMATYLFAGVGSFLLIWSLIIKPRNPIKSFFQLSLFKYLGKISYGLYIYHVFALVIVDLLFKRFIASTDMRTYILFMVFFGLSLTILFSIASYHVIEKRFLSLKEKLH